ncbi:MAG: GNAT family N-acetyltransferase [Bacilli bacterium]|nr:GNAT family N-acetyltransferase [Bacilli bacterium]
MIKVDLKTDLSFLKEYVELCALEWGKPKNNIEIQDKINLILSGDKVISVLGIVEDRKLIGFISLFKYDGDERKDLSPWYATMYVKEEYRGNGYSKVLNEMIIEEAIKLGYKRIYLKTDLNNYYEKFGAIYVEDLKCGEKLYYIDCVK